MKTLLNTIVFSIAISWFCNSVSVAQYPESRPLPPIQTRMAWVTVDGDLITEKSRPETRSREVEETVIREETRTRQVIRNGVIVTEDYAVAIPSKVVKTQDYTVMVPSEHKVQKYRIYQMAGQRIVDEAAKRILQQKQIVVYVPYGEKLDSRFRSILRPTTLVIMDLQPPSFGFEEPPTPSEAPAPDTPLGLGGI